MQFIQAANHWNGREGQTPRYLVLHGTAGGSSAVDVANYFAQPSTQASAHYVIGLNGEVVQCVREEDAAWGNGIISGPSGKGGDGVHHDSFWDTGINPNLVSISIEHVKPHTDNSDQLTQAQKQASFKLVEDICNRWGIPKRWADEKGGITGHYSVDPVSRARCPGPYPWAELFAYLNPTQENDMLQLTDPLAKAFFKDDGGKGWYCAHTQKHIGGAIQTYYRQIFGAPRLPLSDEMKDSRGVTYQIFEAGIIVFDPNHVIDSPPGFDRCYLVKFSDPIVQRYLVKPVQDKLNQAQQEIAALEAQSPVDLKALLSTLQSVTSQLQKVVH